MGGCVTILVFTAIAVQTIFAFHTTLTNPQYMSYPTTYNYDFAEPFELHPNYNLFSFKLMGGSLTQDEINTNLRVTFVDSLLGGHIPSMYCDMVFSE